MATGGYDRGIFFIPVFPPGSAVEPHWPRGQGSAPLLKYVKDLTPSDTLVNCTTYIVCTLWYTFFTVTNIL
jgi:hypothetical protein